MVQSEKLKAKLIESTHQLPNENLLLVDLPGEEWKPLPFAPYDEYYMVSNKGRIKRLTRVIIRKNGVRVYLPERIVKQIIQRRYNHYLKQEFYSLQFNTAVDGIKKTFATNRIVYYTFVRSFNLSDPNLIIRYKDGNGLNTALDNLYTSTRKELPQWIVDNDHRSRLIGASDQKRWPEEELQRWNNLRKKSVSQYDPKGRLVAVGEVWKAIPGTNEIYFASNYGRIKSIERIIERKKIKLWYEAHIIHQSAEINKKGRLRGLVTHFISPAGRFNFQVPRLIYNLFIGDIPPKYTIKFKDNDPFNCRAENLGIQPISNFYRPYFEQRRLLYERDCKRFAQYTPEGKLINIYKSIYEAAEKSGFEKDKLSECARGKRKTVKGFIWKFIDPDEEISG